MAPGKLRFKMIGKPFRRHNERRRKPPLQGVSVNALFLKEIGFWGQSLLLRCLLCGSWQRMPAGDAVKRCWHRMKKKKLYINFSYGYIAFIAFTSSWRDGMLYLGKIIHCLDWKITGGFVLAAFLFKKERAVRLRLRKRFHCWGEWRWRIEDGI